MINNFVKKLERKSIDSNRFLKWFNDLNDSGKWGGGKLVIDCDPLFFKVLQTLWTSQVQLFNWKIKPNAIKSKLTKMTSGNQCNFHLRQISLWTLCPFLPVLPLNRQTAHCSKTATKIQIVINLKRIDQRGRGSAVWLLSPPVCFHTQTWTLWPSTTDMMFPTINQSIHHPNHSINQSALVNRWQSTS